MRCYVQTSPFQMLVWSMDYCSAIVYYGCEYLSISPSLPEDYQNNSTRYFNDHCKFNMHTYLWKPRRAISAPALSGLHFAETPSCILQAHNSPNSEEMMLNALCILSDIMYIIVSSNLAYSCGSMMGLFSVIKAGTFFLPSLHLSSYLLWASLSFLLPLPCSLNYFTEKYVICLYRF